MHTSWSLAAPREGREMNSDEQRNDRQERLAAQSAPYVSVLPVQPRQGARACRYCGATEAMPGHEC